MKQVKKKLQTIAKIIAGIDKKSGKHPERGSEIRTEANVKDQIETY